MGILDRFSMRRQEAAAAPPDAEEGAGIAGLAEALETIKARGALVRRRDTPQAPPPGTLPRCAPPLPGGVAPPCHELPDNF